jgi:transposase-like protein
MTCIVVPCPHCHRERVVKRGKTDCGTQRYLCQNTAWVKGSVLLDYRNRGCVPEVKHQIVDMAMNARGIRDTARVLHMSPTPCGLDHRIGHPTPLVLTARRAVGRSRGYVD